jgi:hypothetical protein
MKELHLLVNLLLLILTRSLLSTMPKPRSMSPSTTFIMCALYSYMSTTYTSIGVYTNDILGPTVCIPSSEYALTSMVCPAVTVATVCSTIGNSNVSASNGREVDRSESGIMTPSI